MGLKYDAHQFKRAGNRLNNSQKAFKRYLIRDMEKLARLVERLSRAMAPLETGSLETAIFARVIKEGYSGLRIKLSVSGAKPRQGHPGVEVGDYGLRPEQNLNVGTSSLSNTEKCLTTVRFISAME